MSPFVTEWQAEDLAYLSSGYKAALEHYRSRRLRAIHRHYVGRYVFVRRKGAARPGRKHSLHGRIIDLDGQSIHVEYHTELGKHLEWFTESEAHIFVC